MSLHQISELTNLKPTGGQNKRDRRKAGNNAEYKFSSIHFEVNPEPREFEDKLKRLLDFLEQDKEGVQRLADIAQGYVQVAIEFHNGMLGGPHINKECMGRMSLLGLAIDFDLYATGKPFASECADD